MTRAAALASAALALALSVSLDRTVVVAGTDRTEVVVLLDSPPLSSASESAPAIAAEQREFRRELAERMPSARVGWRYRLVANGFSVSVPSAQVPRLATLQGVRDVLPSATYGPQLDRTPGQIGAPVVWGPTLDTQGQGTKIGIIDSGVDASHPFFDPAGYAMPPGFPKGQQRFTTAKVIVARAFPPRGSTSPSAKLAFDASDISHGTHVAGIAAGNPQTPAGSSRLVSGVAPRAYIGNYKVFVETDSGISPNANSPAIAAAIEAAVADGMDVINFSGGEPEIEPSRDIVALALDAAAAAGVVPVVAAGNDFRDVGAGSVSSPANSERAITAGAVEISGNPLSRVHADFSSVGPTAISLRLKPDVAAPGVDVLSSVPGGWDSFSGTSMAAPHVAGAAALLAQRHPDWTVAEVKSALVQTGVDATDDASKLLPPAFQGGGVVALAGADRPLLFAEPSSISLGLLGGRGSADELRSIRVQLRDSGGGAGAWAVSVVELRSAPGVSITLASSEVSVPGELAFEIRAAGTPREGEISGYVVLRRGTDVRRIPYWGRRTAQNLGRHRVVALARPGVYRATTKGRPALVTRYRYPESPRGVGVTTTLRGPELVYRFVLKRRVANFGVVVTSRVAGARVEPRAVAALDENRLTGYAGLPVNHNPYLEGFRSSVPAAGALSPRPGEYELVFDSATRAGAGRFAFRFWVNDVTPPTLRMATRVVHAGAPLRVFASDAGSGVYPPSIVATIDGNRASGSFRSGVVSLSTRGLSPGTHRLRLRASDYQETKNTENVARILPNTRMLTTTFRMR
ncbi:MAG TPA: S8 family serine peptidase [Gaiellaceae bacterium]|nr:S8 family serine peptidase [Gaiellaceae bacterium]